MSLPLFIIAIFFSTALCGQDPPIEHQEMRLIGELTGHVDVAFKVVKCENSSSNQVFVHLENESERYGQGSDVTSQFDLVILNYQNGDSFTQTFNVTVAVGQSLSADCEVENTLKIDLPESYSPTTIAAYIQQD